MKEYIDALRENLFRIPTAEDVRSRELRVAQIELLQSEKNRESAIIQAEAYAAQSAILRKRITRLGKEQL